MRAALLASLFLVTLIALAPAADAKPDPPECVWEGPSVTVGPATVSSYCGEGPRVAIDEECLRDGTC